MINQTIKLLFVGLFSLFSLSAAPQYDIVDLGFSNPYFVSDPRINAQGSVLGETYSPQGIEIDELFLASEKHGFVSFPSFENPLLHEAINSSDLVIGNSKFRGGAFISLAWVWHPERGFIHIGHDEFRETHVWDINDSGTIVGYGQSNKPFYAQSLFVYDLDNGFTFIDEPSEKLTLPIKINGIGQVMANQYKGNPFIYEPVTGKKVEIPFSNCRKICAEDINDRGEVAGFAVDDEYRSHAFFYSPDKGGRLLGSSTQRDKQSEAIALNEKGEVIGVTLHRGLHAFFWSAKTGLIDLAATHPKLKEKESLPYAINNRGEVVGFYIDRHNDEFQTRRAFRWTIQKGIEDLIDLIPLDQGWIQLLYATGINDKGEIVGLGVRRGGAIHLFKLIPRS
jgi:probable HAF family extracellular repeat protein